MIPQKGKRIALMAAVVLLACMSAGCRQHIETGNQKQPYTIGAVTKSKDSEYWMSVCSGMEKAADDFGVSVNSYDTKILKKGIPYIGMDNKKWEKSLRRLWRISWKMGQLRLSTIQEKPFRAMIRERRYSVQREWRQQAMIRQARGLLNLTCCANTC